MADSGFGMDSDDDHYQILGLPSGEEGMNLTLKEIEKAYRNKARVIHPDKNPNDPHAKSKFQQLRESFDVLRSETARKAFDDLLRSRLERARRDSQFDAKRRRMVSDLEARERATAAEEPVDRLREEEERAKKRFQEEIAMIRAMAKQKSQEARGPSATRVKEAAAAAGIGAGSDKEKVLKVSWETRGGDYTPARLRELFGEFGEVEDVVIRSGKKRKGSALVVMASKDAAGFAAGMVCGDSSNPLQVNVLDSSMPNVSSATSRSSVAQDLPNLSHLVGAGYQAYEDSVLEKLQKAAERQRNLNKPS